MQEAWCEFEAAEKHGTSFCEDPFVHEEDVDVASRDTQQLFARGCFPK